ncbi:unnamed protein product, partial [Meganyctiphanes norvegica]
MSDSPAGELVLSEKSRTPSPKPPRDGPPDPPVVRVASVGHYWVRLEWGDAEAEAELAAEATKAAKVVGPVDDEETPREEEEENDGYDDYLELAYRKEKVVDYDQDEDEDDGPLEELID